MIQHTNSFTGGDAPFRYDAATPFYEEGYAIVFQFGLQFRINKEGEMIWQKGEKR